MKRRGRTIAGIGAGGILSGALTILSLSVPRAQVAVFNGILGAVNGIAFICGPLLSGGIINGTTWRWCVYVRSDSVINWLMLVGYSTSTRSCPPQPSP